MWGSSINLLLVALLWLPFAVLADELRLHTSALPQLNIAAISRIIDEEAGVTIVRSGTDLDPLTALTEGVVDLAVVENTRPFTEGVRTILPLYPGVVHLSVRDDIDWTEVSNPQSRILVELVGATHTARLVMELMFARATSIPREFTEWSEDMDQLPEFSIYVGPLIPELTAWFRDGYSLVSMGRAAPASAEFFTEGISYLVPQLTPTRIPALTYALPGNETGIDSLAVDMLLLTRRDTDAASVYRVAEVLLEQKARFAAAEPQLFRWLREDFPREHLNFPLHQGTRNYLARDEPRFLERYAEALNFLVYMVALAVTGVIAFGRWRARSRKERIDLYYARILALRVDSAAADPDAVLRDVNALEAEAVDLLMRERLSADESFRIFMELASNLRREMRERNAKP